MLASWGHQRGQARKVGEQLEARARLFRSVQKRLLLRFRDKNPAPLNQLDALMDDTYHALADLAAAMDRQALERGAERASEHRLRGPVTSLPV